MLLETKLAKFDKDSAVLGKSWISIDKNFDWFADFKKTYSWLTIFWNANEDILALIEAATLYWINNKNTLKAPHKITVTKNLEAYSKLFSRSILLSMDEKDWMNGFIEERTTTSLKLSNNALKIIK